MSPDNHLRQIQWLTTLLASLAIVLVSVVYVFWKPPDDHRFAKLILDAIPSAIVALIAIPVVYFIFTRQGIATRRQIDPEQIAALVSQKLSALPQQRVTTSAPVDSASATFPTTLSCNVGPTVLAVEKGSILECHGRQNTVLYPANVFFDTTFEAKIVESTSTLGLYLRQKVAPEDLPQLDNDLNNALSNVDGTDQKQVKLPGKPGRTHPFPLGSVCYFSHGGESIGLFAATRLVRPDRDYKADLDEHDFHNALTDLWEQTRKTSIKGDLCMPIIGSGFGNMNRASALAHILLSFRAAAMHAGGKVCRKLVIIVYHTDWKDGKWVNDLFSGLFPDGHRNGV